MAIRLTFHATQRLELRGITREHVESVVRFPRSVASDPAHSAVTISVGECSGRMLRVIHRQLGEDILIITAYWQ